MINQRYVLQPFYHGADFSTHELFCRLSPWPAIVSCNTSCIVSRSREIPAGVTTVCLVERCNFWFVFGRRLLALMIIFFFQVYSLSLNLATKFGKGLNYGGTVSDVLYRSIRLSSFGQAWTCSSSCSTGDPKYGMSPSLILEYYEAVPMRQHPMHFAETSPRGGRVVDSKDRDGAFLFVDCCGSPSSADSLIVDYSIDQKTSEMRKWCQRHEMEHCCELVPVVQCKHAVLDLCQENHQHAWKSERVHALQPVSVPLCL